MENKKIAVIAGTPVDTKMGADFLNSKGLNAFSYPVSQDPREQLLFQTLPVEQRKEELLKLISKIKDDKMDAIFVYCNSLSASIDFHEDVYKRQVDDTKNLYSIYQNCTSPLLSVLMLVS